MEAERREDLDSTEVLKNVNRKEIVSGIRALSGSEWRSTEGF